MDCIICGNWFSSTIHDGACPTCSRAMKQLGLNMMPGRLLEIAQAEKDGRLVVHGRWRFHKYVSKYECTECGHFVKPGTDRNYCPNCGAKMDFPEAALKKREELDL